MLADKARHEHFYATMDDGNFNPASPAISSILQKWSVVSQGKLGRDYSEWRGTTPHAVWRGPMVVMRGTRQPKQEPGTARRNANYGK